MKQIATFTPRMNYYAGKRIHIPENEELPIEQDYVVFPLEEKCAMPNKVELDDCQRVMYKRVSLTEHRGIYYGRFVLWM